MSGATYRIEVSNEPSCVDDSLPYVARASRFDGEPEFTAWGATAGLALAKVRVMIVTPVDPPETFYADEYGNLIDPPQSVTIEHDYCAECGRVRSFTEGKCDRCASPLPVKA